MGFETHLIGPYLVEAHKHKPLASVSVFFTDHHGGNSPIDQILPAAYLTVTISVARRRSIKKQNDVAEPGGSSPILDIQPKTPKSSMDDIPCCLVLRFYREERQSHAFAGQFISRQRLSLLPSSIDFVIVQETRMRDRFTLYARGGEGGSGCSSLRRSRTDRFGKPNGKETYLKSDNTLCFILGL